MTCEYLEGCYNDTRLRCWFCSSPICGEHSNLLVVPTLKGDKRSCRVCDDCLNGEVRP